MDEELTHGAQRTLFRILHHPTSQNVGWDELVALLTQVADVEKMDNGGRLVVRLGDERLTLQKPNGSPVPEQPLLELRRMLEHAGVG